jgi:hypothetical protein
MAAMPRSLSSLPGKPASLLPFQASCTESPSENAISPRPACSRFKFSTDALVACTCVRTSLMFWP